MSVRSHRFGSAISLALRWVDSPTTASSWQTVARPEPGNRSLMRCSRVCIVLTIAEASSWRYDISESLPDYATLVPQQFVDAGLCARSLVHTLSDDGTIKAGSDQSVR